ncbi:MAG: acetyl-CoA C-acyltransferase, partial [Actinomycetota bacterium]|nr:acetyl-CoA C-acyltransferase [Actinomycetota bacterium]
MRPESENAKERTVTTETVIVGYARTPIGKFGGGFQPLSAMDLGAEAIKAA